jgi:hypothetical protein
VTLSENVFNGSGPNVGEGFGAFPFGGETTTLAATGNEILHMGSGFALAPQSGSPGGTVNATLSGNTVDGSLGSAVSFSVGDNGRLEGAFSNNRFFNSGRYGYEGSVGTGGVLGVTSSRNYFHNNTLGMTDNTLALGTGDVEGTGDVAGGGGCSAAPSGAGSAGRAASFGLLLLALCAVRLLGRARKERR